MKGRYHFFLMVAGWFYCPYLSQAIPNKAIIPGFASSSTKLLDNHVSSKLTSSKIDEVALLRKTMRIQAMVQRSWIGSMVIPGLGQGYNKDYWKVPCLYLGFALVGSRIYAEHQDMNKHKRTLLIDKSNKPNDAFTKKRIQECERTRNLFIIIASAWYLLNIFDAYAGSHDKTVNFKDDIGTTSTANPTTLLQPTRPACSK